MTRVVLVTGASRGIGLAVAEELLKIGTKVYGIGRSTAPEGPAELEKKFGPQSFAYVPADVASSDDQERVLGDLLVRFGRLDAVVHNAGVLEPIVRVDALASDSGAMDAWRRAFEINVTSVAELSARCLPQLRQNLGRLVFVSSGAATHAYQGWAAYGCTKAALNMLAATLAVEEPDVCSVAVRPGVVDTDMQGVIRQTGQRGMSPEQHAQFVAFQQSGQLLPPAKPARILAQLAAASGSRVPADLNGRFFSWNDGGLSALGASID